MSNHELHEGKSHRQQSDQKARDSILKFMRLLAREVVRRLLKTGCVGMVPLSRDASTANSRDGVSRSARQIHAEANDSEYQHRDIPDSLQ
jgi:hypothetical protein